MDLERLVRPARRETPRRERASTGRNGLLIRLEAGRDPAGRERPGTAMLTPEAGEHGGGRDPLCPGATARPAPPQVSRSGRRLREELERAARVQRSLLPDVSRPVGQFGLTSLYWPREAVGGDLYDLAWRRDCAVLLVSDVMGHGVEAALITMLVKAAFQGTAETTGEPGELLLRMNARLRRMLPPHIFVAAAVARLDLESPVIRLANAGLPHPFLLHASARSVEELPLEGRPLGLIEGQGEGLRPVRRLELEPGDVLLVTSDGIGCIESACGQCFEDCRLRQVLAELAGQEGRSVVDRLAAQAVAFGRGRPLPDDLNLVAVSRKGREAGAFGA
jgi:sigma-B regulation protein RsbU (phosphoserine phosphatase)